MKKCRCRCRSKTTGLALRAYSHESIRPWLLRILEFVLVEKSVTGVCLRIHEGDFGLHPISFSKN
jgi:hypothetical protein